ncbi:hypothetical protein EDB92DRAFT_1907125 [Lactarius akahatsu]|uniref:Uncharacterized protein n=1 Tax=Lactarius akahatsu TaxID=416441 RepID=A0AAD4L5F1_9AGAM|nr:hypothetical protein EDB92DRAFT_1907125 [Lactarius akahatsu]
MHSQNEIQRHDSSRPPDAGEVVHHNMVRTTRRRTISRQHTTQERPTPHEPTQINPVLDPANPQDPTTLPASTPDHATPQVLCPKPRVRFPRSQNHDTPQEVPRPTAEAERRQRIEAWRTQVITERPSRLRQPDPIRACANALESFHFQFMEDPRNYAYDYTYPDARHED